MSKSLLFLSLICLVVLIVGTSLIPNNPTFWLAAHSANYQHIREILSVVLVGQLLTSPPRNLFFRLLAGGLGLGVGVWALYATYANQMMLLDGMSLVAAAMAIGITSLELRPFAEDVPELSPEPVDPYLGWTAAALHHVNLYRIAWLSKTASTPQARNNPS